MAIFHTHFSKVQRSKGQNAIASAAYIGGIKLQKLDGELADYSKKRGVCGHRIIMPSKFEYVKVPTAQWVWAHAEEVENRKNSTTARRGDLALPREFTKDECFAVGYAYAQDIADRYGVIAQVDFHDLATDNPHIDMQWTTRIFDGEKLGVKTRELDDKKTGPEEIVWMREQWAKRVNAILEKYGQNIDHRSYEEQGIDKIPTKHLGRYATALERKGDLTEFGEYNAKAQEHNRLVDEKKLLNQGIAALERQLKEKENVRQEYSEKNTGRHSIEDTRGHASLDEITRINIEQAHGKIEQNIRRSNSELAAACTRGSKTQQRSFGCPITEARLNRGTFEDCGNVFSTKNSGLIAEQEEKLTKILDEVVMKKHSIALLCEQISAQATLSELNNIISVQSIQMFMHQAGKKYNFDNELAKLNIIKQYIQEISTAYTLRAVEARILKLEQYSYDAQQRLYLPKMIDKGIIKNITIDDLAHIASHLIDAKNNITKDKQNDEFNTSAEYKP